MRFIESVEKYAHPICNSVYRFRDALAQASAEGTWSSLCNASAPILNLRAPEQPGINLPSIMDPAVNNPIDPVLVPRINDSIDPSANDPVDLQKLIHLIQIKLP